MTISADVQRRLAAIDAALAKGIADADAGRVKPAEDVLDRLEAKYKGIGRDQAQSSQIGVTAYFPAVAPPCLDPAKTLPHGPPPNMTAPW